MLDHALVGMVCIATLVDEGGVPDEPDDDAWEHPSTTNATRSAIAHARSAETNETRFVLTMANRSF